MLVLSRRVGEQLNIGRSICVVVHRVAGNRVTIGVEAPNDVRITRGELAIDTSLDNEPSKLEQIERLCLSRNNPGVNVGAHQLANAILKIIGGEA